MDKKTANKMICGLTILNVVPVVATAVMYSNTFGKRINFDNKYFEYIQRYNKKIKRNPINFKSNKGQTLKGYFYRSESQVKPKALIIYAHGMGVNHENYISEINYLVESNYVVFSYDNTGVNSSEGKNIKGLTQAVIDLKYALAHIEKLEDVDGLKKILIGHSWGAYAVSAVHNYRNINLKIDGIIALAGFERNQTILKYRMGEKFNKISKILMPYVGMYQYAKFGRKFKMSGVRGLKQTDAKVLIIHSKDDVDVPFNNYLKYYKAFKNNDRFTFVTYEDAGHRLTLLPEAISQIKSLEKKQSLTSDPIEIKKLESAKYKNLTKFNYQVLRDITLFLNDILETETTDL